MSEQKDKCPECYGTGEGQAYPHKCSVCKGTGEKKLDKSELNPPPRFDEVFERGLRNMDSPERGQILGSLLGAYSLLDNTSEPTDNQKEWMENEADKIIAIPEILIKDSDQSLPLFLNKYPGGFLAFEMKHWVKVKEE